MSEAKRTGPPKGVPKTPGSGRKKGTPNKRNAEFMELLRDKNFSPAEELIFIYRETKKIFDFRKKKGNLAGALTALDTMADVAEDLCQYAYPKKKAVEHTGEVGVRTFSDFIALADKDDDEDDEEC